MIVGETEDGDNGASQSDSKSPRVIVDSRIEDTNEEATGASVYCEKVAMGLITPTVVSIVGLDGLDACGLSRISNERR